MRYVYELYDASMGIITSGYMETGGRLMDFGRSNNLLFFLWCHSRAQIEHMYQLRKENQSQYKLNRAIWCVDDPEGMKTEMQNKA